MRACYLSFIFLLPSLSAAVAEPQVSREEVAAPLRVLSYNVRYASDQPPNAWAARRPVAMAMLNQLDVDIIGMQEALFQQVKDFATDLPLYQWIGTGRDGGSRGEFMAVFYRADRLEPVEFDHFWLSDTPDVIASSSWGNVCNRMVTWVRFRDRRTQQELFFINTHLDHQIQESRDKSAALIVEKTKALPANIPLVLVGDFNSLATRSSVYKTFMEAGFVDTWQVAAEHGPEVGTMHNYHPTGSNRCIDWILTRGGVRSLFSEIVQFEQGGQYPSDHFPVLAELRIESWLASPDKN